MWIIFPVVAWRWSGIRVGVVRSLLTKTTVVTPPRNRCARTPESGWAVSYTHLTLPTICSV
eukprot:14604616-Alexandrium_andersonii.AAC.1